MKVAISSRNFASCWTLSFPNYIAAANICWKIVASSRRFFSRVYGRPSYFFTFHLSGLDWRRYEKNLLTFSTTFAYFSTFSMTASSLVASKNYRCFLANKFNCLILLKVCSTDGVFLMPAWFSCSVSLTFQDFSSSNWKAKFNSRSIFYWEKPWLNIL